MFEEHRILGVRVSIFQVIIILIFVFLKVPKIMFLNIKQIRNELDDLFSFLRLNMQSFPFCLQQTKHFLTQKFPKEEYLQSKREGQMVGGGERCKLLLKTVLNFHNLIDKNEYCCLTRSSL